MQGCLKAFLVALAAILVPGDALILSSDDRNKANPIRKVVNLLEKMTAKIEEEAEKEEKLYEKFECYCKKSAAELEQSIEHATASPITQADIDAKQSEIQALEQAVGKMKADRIAEEEALKRAEAQRAKEHEAFVVETDEEKDVVKTVDAAVGAITGNSTGSSSSVQGGAQVASLLQAIERNYRLSSDDKKRAAAFLTGRSRGETRGESDPSYAIGILSGVKDDTVQEIKTETNTEDTAQDNFKTVEESKKISISTLLRQFERKLKQIGELRVEKVNMESRMSQEGASLEENKKMLADLQKSCAEKAKDWTARKAARAEETAALHDTIKVLNSDESLDLFRKRSTSFVQLHRSKELRRARGFVQDAMRQDEPHPELNFLALALTGKKVDFSKVFTKIDNLIDLIMKEGEDDRTKKAYCETELRKNQEKTKALQSEVKTLTASMDQKEEAVTKLADDIKALQQGVKALDDDVAQAGANRKEQHDDYQSSIADDSTAVDLLRAAKLRLNKFYRPELVSATTTKSPYDLSLLQVDEAMQHVGARRFDVAFRRAASSAENTINQESKLSQAPETFNGDYKKNEQSNGVFKMLDMLVNDIEKEMAVAKTEENDAQEEYEQTLKEAAKKREADLALAAEKAGEKAEVEGDMSEESSQAKSAQEQSTAATKFAADLHAQCDWLLANFELRKDARSEEKENLIRAKTVLEASV
eukprot:TRINITY_DN8390_c0_g1_i1.p1 TRINITY_DN8390_c0_g1~~TRINITY_DN8390_c0_g1_i1.p1  ORF type:complete len:705 (-),score=244.19 TRINITY_DN8390_c0_g1_i1:61-2175(-)